MKNKGFMFLGIVLLLFTFVFVSCISTPAESFTPGGSEDLIIGIWELQPTGKQYPQTFIFEEGGTFMRQNRGEIPQTGYYSYDGTILNLATNYFNSSQEARLEDNKLTIFYSSNNIFVYIKSE